MRIAIIAYQGISPFMLSTPLAVFGEPFLASGHDVMVCGESNRISASSGLVIETAHPLAAASQADVVILPGWRDSAEPVSPAIVRQLRSAHERNALVAGLCLGAFGLAEAGLLDGRRATTHWARVAELGARYLAVQINPEAIYVDDGQVVTSAGIAAGLDCCLHLLARLSGVAEANRVARHLVVAPQRSGEQPQLIERPAPATSAERRVADILEQLWADPSQNPSLDELASRARVSRRSLSRHIRARTGGSLGGWLRRARIARAQDILLRGEKGLERIAARSGFADAPSLRKAFRGELGMTPTQWLARQRIG
ncbi:GlxA family transcriptional regulator [Roseibium marinum]|uniref:Transcriptional regulator GlxA family with amidase domain n=1 Tax=Roseibium marinum TaxID=281252 RepID=A0A2S3ULN6_9HYPH|nr:DJ-1/PfpI family protein [Roseibium marinum]POF28638.1 transcriptional regulator GlxA family with amidase domain [Roseibium marinum]